MGLEASRTCVLTVCLPDGTILGDTAPFDVASPWPAQAEQLADAATAMLGVPVTVLRLIQWDERPDGTPDLTRYVAEVAIRLTGLARPSAPLSPDSPLRAPWARPGGPEAQLRWARNALVDAGMPLTGAPVQMRTWNLSSLWRLPTANGDVWMKAVPPFFAHEGVVLERLAGHPVPRVIARGDGIALLRGIPGEDLYAPPLARALDMIDVLVRIQRDLLGAHDERLRLGLPDWRVERLAEPGARALAAAGAHLEPAERLSIERLIDGLGTRAAAVAACGIPDSLVHGDFHPGNVRGDGDRMTLLDWGDSGWGHPMLDEAAFTERMPAGDRDAVRTHWAGAWAAAVPGSDAARAASLLAPVGALRQAGIYQGFLDRIEPDERVYHRRDVPEWLRRTAALV